MCNSEQVEGLKIWEWGQTLLVEQTANMLWYKVGSTSPSCLEANAGFFILSIGVYDVEFFVPSSSRSCSLGLKQSTF